MLAVVFLFAIVTAPVFYGVATSEQLEENTQNFEDWCDANDGDLVYVHAVYDGGLKCQLPNGDTREYSETLEHDS